jgi:hypothetical protein
VKAGEHQVSASFAQTGAAAPEGGGGRGGGGFGGGMALDRMIIEGPLKVANVGETSSRARIFSCKPARPADDDACAEKILSTLARRAYRRPVTRDEVSKLLTFYRSGKNPGGFESGIQFALERLLVSPNFLLRVEHDPANAENGVAYRVPTSKWRRACHSSSGAFRTTGIECRRSRKVEYAGRRGSRSSGCLWTNGHLRSSRTTQRSGCISRPEKLMPDPAFPDFTENLREEFVRETQMFLMRMRQDHSVPHMLTADYTFANEDLARFYGIPSIYRSHFRQSPSRIKP